MNLLAWLVILFISLISCQSKGFENLSYVKTYSIDYPYVMAVKTYTAGYTADPGILAAGFYIRDSDGKLLQDLSIVESIRIISPSGIIWDIPPKTPFGYYGGVVKGFYKYGESQYYTNSRTTSWCYLWQYFDVNFHDGEEGNYVFNAVVKGKTITSKAYFQKFNGGDPLGTMSPDIINYDKNTRVLRWNRVPNAEGYRIFIFRGPSMDFQKLIYNSNGEKISNIWDADPDPAHLNEIIFTIPNEVLLNVGEQYTIRVDAYIFTKTIFVQDSNYSHNYYKTLIIN